MSESTVEKFKKYHKSHPATYEMLVHLCKQAKDAGYTEHSMRALFYQLRWYINPHTKQAKRYHIPNAYSPYYARLIMSKEKGFENFFKRNRLK